MDIINLSLFNTEEILSLGQFAKRVNLTTCSPVKRNLNGYAYVTITVKDVDGSDNIYLSKGASKKVEEGMLPTNEAFKELKVRLTANAHGEARLKFCRADSDQIDISDLGWE